MPIILVGRDVRVVFSPPRSSVQSTSAAVGDCSFVAAARNLGALVPGGKY